MKKYVYRLLTLVLSIVILTSQIPAASAYEVGDPYDIDLSNQIDNIEYRSYVEMMLDFYLRNDSEVQNALQEDLSAVFMFEGCSDNMSNSELSDLSYYRVSASCIVLRLNDSGNPYIAYFNEDCSTIPDRPLEYGAWWLENGGDVGPATICDGTYQLFSTSHLGQYDALNVRDSSRDYDIAAVYMSRNGFSVDTANGINIHTRDSNHISGGNMWSEGCQLVGHGNFNDFSEFMNATYYAAYSTFNVEKNVGTLTLNRAMLIDKLYNLYGNVNAVDTILAESLSILPSNYLTRCKNGTCYMESKEMRTTKFTDLMTLPCSNKTDARSLLLTSISEGYELEIVGEVYNTANNKWYQVNFNGQICYVYSKHVEDVTEGTWYSRFF